MPNHTESSRSGFVSLVYGVAVYAFLLCTFLYAIGFIGNVFVPKTIDSGAPVPVVEALVVNLALVGLLTVQHRVMAWRGFKCWWTQMVHAGGRAQHLCARCQELGTGISS